MAVQERVERWDGLERRREQKLYKEREKNKELRKIIYSVNSVRIISYPYGKIKLDCFITPHRKSKFQMD